MIDFLPAIIGHVALWSWVVYLFLRKRPDTMSHFKAGVERVAQELGAQFPGRRAGSESRSAYGTIGDMTVAITVEPLGDVSGGPATQLIVDLEGPRIPSGVSLAKEGGGGQDVLTGDPRFDDAVEVHGEPSIVLALLDEELRPTIAAFVGNGGSLRSGRLRCHDHPEPLQDQVPALVRTTRDLAEALSSVERRASAPRLARNVAEDPVAEVRRLNLLQLQAKFTASPEAMATSRAALSDTSPWVRLEAARFLRAEVSTLEALVRDREVPDQAAAEAVALLADRLAPERAGPLLVEILELRAGDTQRQAVEKLEGMRYGPAFGPLVVLLERADARTSAAAAKALGALGDPRAEARLIAALDGGAAEVRLAAAHALGDLGTKASVEPLLALAESRGLDAAARQAVRGAIASIQSRLVGAGAGQLTVAASASESGRLSLAGSEAGALSLADEPETEK